MEWPSTLVIILSVLLSIMIIFCIVVVGFIILILQRLNRVAKRAEEASENWAGMVRSLGKKMAPAAVSAGAAMILRKFKRRRGSHE